MNKNLFVNELNFRVEITMIENVCHIYWLLTAIHKKSEIQYHEMVFALISIGLGYILI